MKGRKTVRPSALIMDDDQAVLELVSFLMQEQFPELEIDCRSEPDLSGDFDIYLIDNDFNGHHMAAELVESIQQSNPASQVFVFSAQLDIPVLKRLINIGCKGVFDKSDPRELDVMLEAVGEFLHSPPVNPRTRRSTTNIVQLVNSITALIYEWNQRLDTEGVRKV